MAARPARGVILLVDDDPGGRSVAGSMPREAGYAVIERLTDCRLAPYS